MTLQAKAILLTLVIAVGYPLIGWSISPPVFREVSAQIGNPVCVLDGTHLWIGGDLMLAAALAPKANKCLEDCARIRHHCEQQDTHRPGSKDNIEWSKQCQGSYNQCMHSCK